jgi:DNA-directed RNA polymerase subunit RPC12/RpoP
MSALAPKHCPRCNDENSFVIDADTMTCRRCGYVIRHGEGVKSPKSSGTNPSLKNALTSMFGDKAKNIADEIVSNPTDTLPIREIRASYGIRYTGELPPYARAAFNSGQAYIERKRYPEAKDAFLRALAIQPDFFDCYYWLALLSTDPSEKREYLTKVIAHMPKHGDAMRELMLLDGKLTPAQADALKNPYQDAEKRQAGGAVKVASRNVRCPNCGSYRMTTDDVTGLPYCDSCGYIGEKSANTAGNSSLFMALLKRRSQRVVWQVGERLLLCNSCGAERTIPNDKLSDYCPYCGSKHVVVHDALGSFSQPDSLIPFSITRQQAGEQIKSQLNTPLARMRRWVDNTTVERATLEGHFLPYWVFDATLEVRRTVIYTEVEMDEEGNYHRQRSQYQEIEEFTDFADAILVCAVKSPPKSPTDRLGKYDVKRAVAYQPALITKYPAQIYSIDFDRASLEARSMANRLMREKHGTIWNGFGQVQNISASATDMQFQLMLMPVWIATLYEEDGDIRTALVNGQTGAVVFGKSQKPPRSG